MITKKGINASPGVAIGPALVLDAEEYRIPRRTIDPSEVPAEIRLLDAALQTSRQEVAELRVAATRKLGDQTTAIFAFHEEFIADKLLRAAVIDGIEKNNYTAAYAFGQELSRRQRLFRNVADTYLKERVRDLYDIEKRVLRHILGRNREKITKLTEPVVIVAHDITPSQAITLDRNRILGFAHQRRWTNLAYGDHRTHAGNPRRGSAERHHHRYCGRRAHHNRRDARRGYRRTRYEHDRTLP